MNSFIFEKQTEFDRLFHKMGFSRVEARFNTDNHFSTSNYLQDEEKIFIQLVFIERDFFFDSNIIEVVNEVYHCPHNHTEHEYFEKYQKMEKMFSHLLVQSNRKIKELTKTIHAKKGISCAVIIVLNEPQIVLKIVHAMISKALQSELKYIERVIICGSNKAFYKHNTFSQSPTSLVVNKVKKKESRNALDSILNQFYD